MNFYGVDWVFNGLILWGIYLTAKKRRFGFIVGGFCSLMGIGFGLMIGSIATVICSTILMVTNIWAYRKWDS